MTEKTNNKVGWRAMGIIVGILVTFIGVAGVTANSALTKSNKVEVEQAGIQVNIENIKEDLGEVKSDVKELLRRSKF